MELATRTIVPMKVGVLALQGAEAQHRAMFARLGVQSSAVRDTSQLDAVDALVLPGGESTTISMLLESSGLFQPVAERLADGMPVLGTCAGMILLSREIIDGRSDQRCFGVFDAATRRNAYGRQVDSFEADLNVPALAEAGLGAEPFHAVFIRAPEVEQSGEGVDVLATVEGRPVLCRQGPVMAASFHPELSGDPRIHALFLSVLGEEAQSLGSTVEVM